MLNSHMDTVPGIEVIEVGSILANSPERSKFICLDGIHMTEPYHRLMAKEWLKYLAGARSDEANISRAKAQRRKVNPQRRGSALRLCARTL
jgi:hypothetical protein